MRMILPKGGLSSITQNKTGGFGVSPTNVTKPLTGSLVQPGGGGSEGLAKSDGTMLNSQAMPRLSGGTPMTASPQTNSAGLPTFSAGNNLINSQIMPGQTSNTAGGALQKLSGFQFSKPQSPTYQAVNAADQSQSRALLDRASQLVMGIVNGGAGGASGQSYNYSPLTSESRDLTMGALRNAMTGTDRSKLAGDAYQLLLERSEPQFQQGLRTIGQKAAALGRIGSGLTTNELTDFATTRERDLDRSRRELANSAAQASLDDRLNLVNAGRGVSDSFSGQDAQLMNMQSAAAGSARGSVLDGISDLRALASDYRGLGQDLEGSQVRERDTAYGMGRDAMGDAIGYEGRQYGQLRDVFGDSLGYDESIDRRGRYDRDEMRGERGYQYGLSRDAQGDRITQSRDEWDRGGDRINRGLQLAGYGSQGNPAGVYGDLAGRYGQGANDAFGDVAGLLAQYGQRGAAGAPTSGLSVEDLLAMMGQGGGVPNVPAVPVQDMMRR